MKNWFKDEKFILGLTFSVLLVAFFAHTYARTTIPPQEVIEEPTADLMIIKPAPVDECKLLDVRVGDMVTALSGFYQDIEMLAVSQQDQSILVTFEVKRQNGWTVTDSAIIPCSNLRILESVREEE